jgi:trehalose 6-phosphate phosphatase
VGGEPVDLWAPFRSRPAHAGIFADFDGTLAPIVSEPADARPLPGLVQVLSELAGVYGRVGVLTGRPVDFLGGLLPPEVLLVGLYGLEVADHGERRDHPQGGSWREVVDHVAATARAGGPPGMTVESKGLSLTLHYRGVPELADAVADFARQQAQRSGLVCRSAKKSVELHPPIDADKGTALREHAEGLSAVCFIGDDLGDLPAFDALDEMERAGTTVVRVAVAGEESPATLCDRADLCLGGPTEVEGLLRSLVPGAAISA